eukprot:GABV01000012.1.p1 GENE.GABV01000012.1~~GABV01000012.1.p1  ORF type:complete len:952 (-),score=191.12 GABV01000012.1:28-2883(-)
MRASQGTFRSQRHGTVHWLSCRAFQALKQHGTVPPCGLGKYANRGAATGSNQCLDCRPGTFSTQTGATECEECERGYFQQNSGRTECNKCAAGTYASETGAFECESCSPGSYQPEQNATDCIPCATGFFQDGRASTTCKKCAVGYYTSATGQALCIGCPAGQFQNTTGQASCRNCPAGKFSGITASKCSLCPTGTFANEEGQPECISCEPGQFQNETGRQYCTGCPGGFFQASPGQERCNPCSVGQSTLGQSGQATCFQCDLTSVAEKPGSVQCERCPLNARSNAARTLCVCVPGFYDSGDRCEACPDGADCTQSGTTAENIKPLAGWWRPGSALSFYRCRFDFQCPSATDAASESLALNAGGGACGENRDPNSPLCGACTSGYFPTIVGECIECYKPGLLWFLFLLILIVVVALFVLLFRWVHYAARGLYMEQKELDAREIKRADKGGDLGHLDPDMDIAPGDRGHGKGLTIHGPPAPVPDIANKLKIVVSFMQVISLMMVMLETPWPTSFKWLLSLFSPLNFDVLQFSLAECFQDGYISHYTRLMALTLIPIFIFLAVAVFYYFPKKKQIGPFRPKGDTPLERNLKTRRALQKFWRIATFAMYLIYPGVSAMILRTFVCKNVDGKDFLLTDVLTECYTSEWQGYASWAWLMILVYPVGIPAFLLWRMYRSRSQFNLPGVKAEIGLFYTPYHTSFWWWELVDMFYKLTIACMLAFVPRESQLRIGMVIVVAYIAAILLVRPFRRKGDDRLFLLVQGLILIILYAGLIFDQTFATVEEDVARFRFLQVERATVESVAAVCLISAVCGVFVMFFLQTGWFFGRKRHAWKRAQDPEYRGGIREDKLEMQARAEPRFVERPVFETERRTGYQKRLERYRLHDTDGAQMVVNPLFELRRNKAFQATQGGKSKQESESALLEMENVIDREEEDDAFLDDDVDALAEAFGPTQIKRS